MPNNRCLECRLGVHRYCGYIHGELVNGLARPRHRETFTGSARKNLPWIDSDVEPFEVRFEASSEAAANLQSAIASSSAANGREDRFEGH
jgi:hypothetical protein